MKSYYLIEKYLENILAKRNLSKNTFLSYKNDLLQFVKYTGIKDLEDLDELKINLFVNFLAKNYSVTSHDPARPIISP